MASDKRFPPGQAVKIICLSSKVEASGTLVEHTGNRLIFRSEQQFSRDAAIKVSWPGWSLLCDVANCRAEDGNYFVGAFLQHSIRALRAW